MSLNFKIYWWKRYIMISFSGLFWFSQTCGSPSLGQDLCLSSPCGGLGCVDSEGQTRCGGEGCDGVVTAASNTWRKARDSEQEIMSAMEEVEKLSKMVSLMCPGLCCFLRSPGLCCFWGLLIWVQVDVLTCVVFFRFLKPNWKQTRQSRVLRMSWWRPTKPNRNWSRATRSWEVSSDRSETSSHVRLSLEFNTNHHQVNFHVPWLNSTCFVSLFHCREQMLIVSWCVVTLVEVPSSGDSITCLENNESSAHHWFFCTWFIHVSCVTHLCGREG